MAQDLTTALASSSATSASKFENFHALLRLLTNSLKESSITFTISGYEQRFGKKTMASEFHVEVPPQNLRKITDALYKAEELNKKVEIVTNTETLNKLDQANKEISRRISRALPATVLLALIENYCEKRSNALIQEEQKLRAYIRKIEVMAVILFILGVICLSSNGLLFFFPRQTSLILFSLPGLILEISGFFFLKKGSLRRKELNRTIQKQDTLNRFKMLPLLIEEISDEERKRATMENLLVSILAHDSKLPEAI